MYEVRFGRASQNPDESTNLLPGSSGMGKSLNNVGMCITGLYPGVEFLKRTYERLSVHDPSKALSEALTTLTHYWILVENK